MHFTNSKSTSFSVLLFLNTLHDVIVMNAECKFSGHRTLAKKFRDVKKLTFFVKTLKKWTRIIRLTHKVLGDDLNCENYNQQCFCNVFGFCRKAQSY